MNGLYRSKIIGTHGPLENDENDENAHVREQESGPSFHFTASARCAALPARTRSTATRASPPAGSR